MTRPTDLHDPKALRPVRVSMDAVKKIQLRNRLAWKIRTERDEDTLRAVAALLGVTDV